tara:strand:- start:417 stop:725 length:309 start_codon:yes stop_codon:yes gene_type:complete
MSGKKSISKEIKKEKCCDKKKKYDIDSIHFQNAVQFEKTNELFLSTRTINGKKGKEIFIDYELKMLEVKSEKDHILVPLQSVRAIYLRSPLKLEQIAKEEKK